MDANDFVYYLSHFVVGHYYDNYYHNYIEVLGESAWSRTFTFTLASKARTYVGV